MIIKNIFMCIQKYILYIRYNIYIYINTNIIYIYIYMYNIYIYLSIWNRGMERILQTGMEQGYGTGVVPDLVPDLII